AALDGLGQALDQHAVGIDRAQYVTAAVQVEQHAARVAAGRREPLGLDPAGIDRAAADVGQTRRHVAHGIETLAHALERGALDDDGVLFEHHADVFDLGIRHRNGLLSAVLIRQYDGAGGRLPAARARATPGQMNLAY